jgi:hypothetical protein
MSDNPTTTSLRQEATAQQAGECDKCEGTGETTSGEDCGTCEGTGNPTTTGQEEQEDIDLGRVPPDLGCNPTTAGEWTVRPVHKKDGTVWPGIGYISDGKRTYGSANFEEGKAIVAAINAALAAEREKVNNLHSILGRKRTAIQEQKTEIKLLQQANSVLRESTDKLREQLAAEREKYVEQREDWIREIQQLQQQLAAAVEALNGANDILLGQDNYGKGQSVTEVIQRAEQTKAFIVAALAKIGGNDAGSNTERDPGTAA